MTNQTIDGVPRELLERIAESGGYVPRRAELRALLDATELQYDGFTAAQAHAVSAGVDELLFGKPADQPQGDTVPVSAHWSDWSMVTLEIEGKHRTYVECGEPKAKPVAWKTGPLTWAYEPDARRHGERHGVLVKPLFDRPVYAAQPQGEPAAYQVVTGFRRRFTRCKISAADCAKHLSENGEKDVRIEPLYAEPPASVAVVLPQRKHVPDFTMHPMLNKEYTGWNAYDAELRRLNPWLANDK